jgi:hypothetical protein
MSTSTVLPHNHTTSAEASSPVADTSPAERVERHFLAELDQLLAEASQQDSLRVLADVLTWTLARIVVGQESSYVTGDILRRFGNYTCRLAEVKIATAEADEAQRSGHPPH